MMDSHAVNMASIGIGVWITALNVKYRDIGQMIGFLTQTVVDSNGLQKDTTYNHSLVDSGGASWWKAGRPARVKTSMSGLVLSDASSNWQRAGESYTGVYAAHLASTLEAKSAAGR